MKNAQTETEFWNNFYKSKKTVDFPSPFAIFCAERYIPRQSKIIDLGTGNGRDAFYFYQMGHTVVGIDLSREAIINNNEKAKLVKGEGSVEFRQANFCELDQQNLQDFNILYSRFTIHSISTEDQDNILAAAYDFLPTRGLFFIEVRTIHDELFGEGKKLSEDEFVTDHYRRFINGTKLLEKLIKLGWKIKFFQEDKGLAVYKNEDPVVARYVLEKI